MPGSVRGSLNKRGGGTAIWVLAEPPSSAESSLRTTAVGDPKASVHLATTEQVCEAAFIAKNVYLVKRDYFFCRTFFFRYCHHLFFFSSLSCKPERRLTASKEIIKIKNKCL